MEFCSDWSKVKSRLEALWQGEIVDRCCAAVMVPPRSGGKYSKFPSTREERILFRTDGEWVLKRNLEMFENTYFAGDAIPIIYSDLGVAGHAGFCQGAEYELEETVWFSPSIAEWSPSSIQFDEESFLYQKTLELTQYLADESKGRYFVSMPNIGGNLDALAHLRGSEDLLVDLLIDPDPVLYALDRIQEVWKTTMSKVYNIAKSANEGGSSVGWSYTWAPGFHGQMQSDISVMLSPDQFQMFVFPELQSQSNSLDYAMYHLDGHQQTKHLDSLLALDKLKAIRWTHVAGQPSPVHFLPTLKKIQAAGKKLLLQIKPGDVEVIMENLSSKGLFLVINTRSREEADSVVKRIEELTHD